MVAALKTRRSFGKYTPTTIARAKSTMHLYSLVLTPDLGNVPCLLGLRTTPIGEAILALIGMFTRIWTSKTTQLTFETKDAIKQVPQNAMLPVPGMLGEYSIAPTNRVFVESRPVYPDHLGVHTLVVRFVSTNNLLDMRMAILRLIAENTEMSKATGAPHDRYKRLAAKDPSYAIHSLTDLAKLVRLYTGRGELGDLFMSLDTSKNALAPAGGLAGIFSDRAYNYGEQRYPGNKVLLLRRAYQTLVPGARDASYHNDLRAIRTPNGILQLRLYMPMDKTCEYDADKFMEHQTAGFPGRGNTFCFYEQLLVKSGLVFNKPPEHTHESDRISWNVHGLSEEHGATDTWESTCFLSADELAAFNRVLDKCADHPASTRDLDDQDFTTLAAVASRVSALLGIKLDHTQLAGLFEFETPGTPQEVLRARTAMYMDVTLTRLTQFISTAKGNSLASKAEKMHATKLMEHVEAMRASGSCFIPKEYAMRGDGSLHGMSAVVEQILSMASAMGSYSSHNILVYLLVVAWSSGHLSYSDQTIVALMGETSVGKSTLFRMLEALLAHVQHEQHVSAQANTLDGTDTSGIVCFDEATAQTLGLQSAPTGRPDHVPMDNPQEKAATSSGMYFSKRYNPNKDPAALEPATVWSSVRTTLGQAKFLATNLLPCDLTDALMERLWVLVLGDVSVKAFSPYGSKSERPLRIDEPDVLARRRPWALFHTLITVVQWAITTKSIPIEPDLSIFDAYWACVMRRVASYGYYTGTMRKSVHARRVANNCLIASAIYHECFALGAPYQSRRKFDLKEFIMELVPHLVIDSTDAMTACGIALVEILPVELVRTVLNMKVACSMTQDIGYDEAAMDSYIRMIASVNSAPTDIARLIDANARAAKRLRDDADMLAEALNTNGEPPRKLYISSSAIHSGKFAISSRFTAPAPPRRGLIAGGDDDDDEEEDGNGRGQLLALEGPVPMEEINNAQLALAPPPPADAVFPGLVVDRANLLALVGNTLDAPARMELVETAGVIGRDSVEAFRNFRDHIVAGVGELQQAGERARQARHGQGGPVAAVDRDAAGRDEAHYLTYKESGNVGFIMRNLQTKPGVQTFAASTYLDAFKRLCTFPPMQTVRRVVAADGARVNITDFCKPMKVKRGDGRQQDRYYILDTLASRTLPWPEMVRTLLEGLCGPYHRGWPVLIPNIDGVPGTAIRYEPASVGTNVTLPNKRQSTYMVRGRSTRHVSVMDRVMYGDSRALSVFGWGIDPARGDITDAAVVRYQYMYGMSNDRFQDHARHSVRYLRSETMLVSSALAAAGYKQIEDSAVTERLAAMIASGQVAILPEFPYNAMLKVAEESMMRSLHAPPDPHVLMTFMDFATKEITGGGHGEGSVADRLGMPPEFEGVYSAQGLAPLALFYSCAHSQHAESQEISRTARTQADLQALLPVLKSPAHAMQQRRPGIVQDYAHVQDTLQPERPARGNRMIE